MGICKGDLYKTFTTLLPYLHKIFPAESFTFCKGDLSRSERSCKGVIYIHFLNFTGPISKDPLSNLVFGKTQRVAFNKLFCEQIMQVLSLHGHGYSFHQGKDMYLVCVIQYVLAIGVLHTQYCCLLGEKILLPAW